MAFINFGLYWLDWGSFCIFFSSLVLLCFLSVCSMLARIEYPPACWMLNDFCKSDGNLSFFLFHSFLIIPFLLILSFGIEEKREPFWGEIMHDMNGVCKLVINRWAFIMAKSRKQSISSL